MCSSVRFNKKSMKRRAGFDADRLSCIILWIITSPDENFIINLKIQDAADC